ncbi:hypothetical protein BDW59DRAFT_152184 [Aspergillus cavernicola]|uniref:Uncharacterized protein n=1 Tax=Aspergillus cavernicola TaxID=176166 RepID=A0ABR4HRZ5_9EURO
MGNSYSSNGGVLKRWHGVLRLTRQPVASWHRDRVREELKERRMAKTWGHRLSETSDVLFSLSRARYDGFPIRSLPSMFGPHYALAYAYMLAKYTSRWSFYRVAAYLSGAPRYDLVREVVNPSKSAKLGEVASRHQIDRVKFKRVSRQLLRVWPLPP